MSRNQGGMLIPPTELTGLPHYERNASYGDFCWSGVGRGGVFQLHKLQSDF